MRFALILVCFLTHTLLYGVEPDSLTTRNHAVQSDVPHTWLRDSSETTPFQQEPNLNALYAELFGYAIFSMSLNYERSFQLHETAFLGLRGGVTYFYGFQGIAEVNAYVGGPKHFLEVGIGTTTFSGWHFTNEDDEENYFKWQSMRPNFRFGYRYQGPKGLLIKAGPFVYADGIVAILPSASCGFAF